MTRSRTTWLFAAVAVAGGFACTTTAEETLEEAIIRTSLVELDATLDGRPGSPLTGPVSVGPDELRDREAVGVSAFENVPELSADKSHGILQPVGTKLSFRAPVLGRAPVLSVTPVRNESFPCPVDHVVSVQPEGRSAQEVTRVRPVMGEARSLEIDLSRWEGLEVRLELKVEVRPGAEAPCERAVWVNPALWWRDRATADWDPDRPNVILVSVDTLRADALGPWRRERSITPSLDAWAAKSDVYETAYTASNATNPSFSSILTGLYPKNHGVYDNTTTLREDLTTLPDVLGKAGWETWGIVSAYHLAVRLGGDFDRFDGWAARRIAGRSVAEAIDWIQDGEEPFFLWLHLFDPHTPHSPPEPYSSGLRSAGVPGVAAMKPVAFRKPGNPPYRVPGLAAAEELYWSEVALVDRELGRFFAFLESRNLPKRSVIVFVSDHGENLEDHGVLYRHSGLWETTTRVPMMIRWPGQTRGRRVHRMVQTVDLFPTILEGVGLQPPTSDGRDLGNRRGDRARPRPIVAEHVNRDGAMVRVGRFKYLRHRENPILRGGVYLYDLESDPEERRNLAGIGHPVEPMLRDLLDGLGLSRDPIAGRSSEVDPEELEQLRALGYLDG